MFDDLLVAIIGEKSKAPPNVDASRAVIAGPRSGNFSPVAMSLKTGIKSESRVFVDGIRGDSTYPETSSVTWCHNGLSGNHNNKRSIRR